MKRSANRRRSPAAEQRKKQRREQLVKFLRLNTWLVLLAVVVLIALILLILVLAASFGVGGCVLLYSDFSVQRSRMAAANAAAPGMPRSRPA